MSHSSRQSHGTSQNITGTTPNTCGMAWDMSVEMLVEQLTIMDIMCSLFFPRISWDAGTPRGTWDTGGTACAVAWNVMSVTGGAPWRSVPRGCGLAGLTGLDAV